MQNCFLAVSMWVAVAVAESLCAADAGSELRWSGISSNGCADLSAFLEKYRTEKNLPAVAGAVVSEEKLIAAGATGWRRAGTNVAVRLEDKFHIGSCTKSMTALLAGLLIKEGKLRTNTTVGEVFPMWEIPAQQRGITLAQLLTHRSGLAYGPSDKLWARAYSDFRGSGRAQREMYLREALKEGVEAQPGEKYMYSNTGYALAGAMIEKLEGRSWEDLLSERVFEPLGMSSAGFGPPSFPGKIDQPLGHQWVKGKAEPVPRSDNPVSIAPAGAVHASILDLARYAAFQLCAINGRVGEITGALREFLYTPAPGQEYAAGWMVEVRNWAGGRALSHAGSNTMFYTVIWLAPNRHRGFVVCTNVGDKKGEDASSLACDQIIGALVEKFAN